ncbi:MAG TPA: sulfite exporter TauE/SafE family protein [Bacillota bacterium]|nr:sulfite exporter TauE/SafE family protein [Bacillota bacterium]
MDFSLIGIGLFVGFLIGLTGVGGAALLTPILILMGINPTLAVGTDLVYNSITKFVGAVQHWRLRTVNLTIALYFAIGSVPSAVFAVHLIHWVEQHFGGADEIVKKSLGIALILIPIATLLKSRKDHNSPQPNSWQTKDFAQKKKITIFIGALLGFIVGLTSIGSGSLFALALMYFYQLNGKEIVGTDITHAFILAGAAGLSHASLGSVNYDIVLQLLIGSLPGVIGGSILSLRVPTKVLRYTILSLIFISGIKLI